MGYYNRDNDRGGYSGRSSGGFRGRGGGGFGRDRDRRPAEMHDVTCDKCGKECQVPFKPSGDKPVLCSDCFKASGGSRGRGSSSGISPEQFNQLNSKLDKIIEILESLEVDVEGDEAVEEEVAEEAEIKE